VEKNLLLNIKFSLVIILFIVLNVVIMRQQKLELLRLVNNAAKNFIFIEVELSENFALKNVGKNPSKLLKYALLAKSPLLFINLWVKDISFVAWLVKINLPFIKLVLDAEKYLQPKERILSIALKNAGAHLFILNV